jgi:hypothetical protein
MALAGIGDTVIEFDDFDIEVRMEVIGEDALRLGGAGSIEELAKAFAKPDSSPTSQIQNNTEELSAMGWYLSKLGNPDDFDISQGIPDGLSGLALERATQAFAALTAA